MVASRAYVWINIFLLLPIYVGCRQVHMATSMFAENPLTWLEQINHYRATVTAGPNFAYQIVLNNMTENCHWDLSCLRYILNGGEPISKKIYISSWMQINNII